MESLQNQQQHLPLANDSFSYSWLINDPARKPSFGSRRPSWETLDFDFGIGLQPPEPILHADQLFYDGLLLPLHLLPPPPPTTDRPSCSDDDNGGASTVSKPLVRKRQSWGSRKMIGKYVMGFLKPFYRCGRRRAAQGKVGPETMSCPVSLSSTPRTSNAYSITGFDVEDSIYEAVLHCKKSITVYTQEEH